MATATGTTGRVVTTNDGRGGLRSGGTPAQGELAAKEGGRAEGEWGVQNSNATLGADQGLKN